MTLDLTVWVRTESEPNKREHWAAKAKRAKRQRAAVANVLQCYQRRQTPCTVRLSRIAPRKLDDDNYVIALKAVRDEVATWLGVDDGSALVSWEYGEQTKGLVREYAVRIEVNP